MRICAIVPTYENAETIGSVVFGLLGHAQAGLESIFVVDDGSAAAARAVCEEVARQAKVELVRRRRNGGKGAAVKTGLAAARAAGFSHAFQIDADGQHDLDAIPDFLAVARRERQAAVFGYPVYDASVSALRRSARGLTRFWVDRETGTGTIRDAMVGFRIYPIEPTLALAARGNRMDFDVEIAVLLAWAGVPIVNRPVAVRYLRPEEGGRSHFQPLRDNLRLAWLHSRLCTTASIRWCLTRLGRPAHPERSG